MRSGFLPVNAAKSFTFRYRRRNQLSLPGMYAAVIPRNSKKGAASTSRTVPQTGEQKFPPGLDSATHPCPRNLP